jgi:hypothetical protein
VVEDLRRLRLEIDSLRSALRATSAVLITDEDMLERIQQLFIAWSTNVRARLAGANVPPEVLSRADRSFTELVHLTSHRSRKQQYLTSLLAIRRTLVDQILLEVAKLPGFLQMPTRTLGAEGLISEIPDIRNELVPQALYGWVPKMKAFLRQYSFDRNVFVMVSYRKRLVPLVAGIKSVLVNQELNPIVAKEHPITDDLYNPIACLLCCNYGIAVFDRPERAQTHNPNVAYELGVMHFLKRPLLILKHKSVKTMPSDFLHKLYENYRSIGEATEAVRNWANYLTHREG